MRRAYIQQDSEKAEALTSLDEARMALAGHVMARGAWRAQRPFTEDLISKTGSLLDTTLHFCHNKTLIGIKNDHF